MKKYTDEELSRILSCAAIGQLSSPSDHGAGSCCIEQAANAVIGIGDLPDYALDRADWYDRRFTMPHSCSEAWKHWRTLSPDDVLKELIERGLA